MTISQTINSALRTIPSWLIYMVGFGWMGWLFYMGATGGLGPEPIEALERRYGELALQLLIASLAVTPLRKFAGLNLMPFRRQIGLMAFYFLLAHFLVWAVLDVQTLARVWADILKRPYVTIGMAGFLLMIPLAFTSNNWSIRKMGGAAWRKLHKLVYPAALLGALHYIWLVKGFEKEPLIYATVIVVLLILRIPQVQLPTFSTLGVDRSR